MRRSVTFVGMTGHDHRNTQRFDFGQIHLRIPDQTGQRFRRKVDTDSGRNWTVFRLTPESLSPLSEPGAGFLNRVPWHARLFRRGRPMANTRKTMRRVRQVLKLTHEAGLTQRQIARSLAMSPTTVGELSQTGAPCWSSRERRRKSGACTRTLDARGLPNHTPHLPT